MGRIPRNLDVIFFRSALYQLLFLPWTLLLCVFCLPMLLLASRRSVQRAAEIWLDAALWLQRVVLGLGFEIRGRENLPNHSAIIAAKHQSAWETMLFHHLLGDPAFILKKELLFLPFIGWYMLKTEQIAIDRSKGSSALRKMQKGAKRAVQQGRSIVIFPEGHRQPAGHTGRYHSGVATLYAMLDLPVVPIALNSGMFWPRNAFLRRPGTITMQILPAIPPGLPREELMHRLQHDIETTTRALEQEASALFKV
jgi:1-acyl-sn-glycerol-3-phosphate acyltransferase